MNRRFEKIGFALVVGCTSACFAPMGTTTDSSPETSSSTSPASTDTTGVPTTGSTGAGPTTSTTAETTGPATTTDASTGAPSSSTGTTMIPAGCDDRTQGGDETDVDCGGSCPPCEADQKCEMDSDCASKACKSGVCLGDPACTADMPCEPSAVACHANECVEFACVDQALDAVICDDGLLCTIDDACVAGACVASSPKVVSLTDVVMNPELGLHYDGTLQAQNAGASVALAGDVNGDGEPDVLIATRKPGNFPTRVYVLFGGPSLATATLAGVEAGDGGFVIEVDTGDTVVSVAAAGDVNQDGFGDVLIGTPLNSLFLAKGGVYVVFGKDGETDAIKLSSIGSAGFSLKGSSLMSASSLGASVAGLGDLNGDGFDDFAVGAPTYRVNNVGVGSVFVVFGTGFPASDEIDDYVANNKARRIDGPPTNPGDFGRVVAPVGDFNKDGNLDLAVGQPSWTTKGRVFVLYLPDVLGSFAVPDVLPAQQGLIVTNSLPSGQFGSALGPAGDFNGDGTNDLAIGSGGVLNKAFIVLGGNIGGTIDSALLAMQNNGFIVSGAANELLGASVWGGLDVNGDGKRDVVLGAPGFNTGTGRAYVAFGRAMPAAINSSDLVAGNGGFAVEGQTTMNNAGSSVALLPDRNGDGKAELILGATGFDTMAENTGRVYIVNGGDCHP